MQTVRIKLSVTMMRGNLSVTHHRLTGRDPVWRRLCQIPRHQIPPRWTLVYRWEYRPVKVQRRVKTRLVGRLVNQRNRQVSPMNPSYLSVDNRNSLAKLEHGSKG